VEPWGDFSRAAEVASAGLPRNRQDPQRHHAPGMRTSEWLVPLGICLLVVGGIVLLLTVRNPTFDVNGGSRYTLEAGRTTVDITRSGRYVPAIDRGPTGSLGIAPIPTDTNGDVAEVADLANGPLMGFNAFVLGEGTWTFDSPANANTDATLVVFSADDPPSRIDWGIAIVFVPLLGAGAALTVAGLVQRRRGSA
jgi:hypothetical protein